ncbi:MAG TPA: DNA polymerase III subunit delta [Candidatus Saccharimonadales bacterium]|nr:DNA polymerase III subunit delta [Candidatus Saccharimonadales bacterium]
MSSLPESAETMTITLTGPNDFMRQQKLQSLIADFVSQYSDMAIERLDGEESDGARIKESIESLPFLTTKKMVVLRQPSKNKEFQDNIDQCLDELPTTTDLIIVEPKLDKRLSYYKVLKKKTNLLEYDEPNLNDAAKWLISQADKLGGKLSPTNAQLLINRVGLSQAVLANELAKLIIHNPDVTLNDIELLTEPTPQSTIFELIDSAFSGDRQKMLALYQEQRLLKVEPQQIIALLTWQFHVMALIKESAGKSSQTIADQTKLNPYVVSKNIRIVKELSSGSLKRMIHELLVLDMDLKSKSIDPDEALQQYLISLSK